MEVKIPMTEIIYFKIKLSKNKNKNKKSNHEISM